MFDWYLTPADRFQYETDFIKYSNNSDTVTLQQLDPLFHQSRISTAEFLQIFQLIDIKYEHQLSQIQFVYFMHVLVSKRRGWEVPVSLPLHIKEEFLKSTLKENVYIRPLSDVNDKGRSLGKSVKELEEELLVLDNAIEQTEKYRVGLGTKIQEYEQAKVEIDQMVIYYQKLSEQCKPELRVKQVEEMVQVLQSDYLSLIELDK